jgi:aerobic C4-dicarboxylate transport protein
MSEMRALTNLVGNGIATVVVAKWEKEIDTARMTRLLNDQIKKKHEELVPQMTAIEIVSEPVN